jgi:hypothetical protein
MMGDRLLIASVEMGALTRSDIRSNEEVVILEPSTRLNRQDLCLAVSSLSKGQL